MTAHTVRKQQERRILVIRPGLPQVDNQIIVFLVITQALAAASRDPVFQKTV
ncbi:MAG: hypothetical protein ACPH9E_11400 [Hyphomonas sp.]